MMERRGRPPSQTSTQVVAPLEAPEVAETGAKRKRGRPRKVGRGKPGVPRQVKPSVWRWRPAWRRVAKRVTGGRVWWLALEIEPEGWPGIRQGGTLAELRALPEREVMCVLGARDARAWRRVAAPWRWRSEAERAELAAATEGIPGPGWLPDERRARVAAEQRAGWLEARRARRVATLEFERRALAETLAAGEAAARAGRIYRG